MKCCCHHRPSPQEEQGTFEKVKNGDTTCGPVCMPRGDGEGDMSLVKKHGCRSLWGSSRDDHSRVAPKRAHRDLVAHTVG